MTAVHQEHHGHYREQAKRDHAENLRHHMADGGDLAQDKAMIRKAIDQHDDQLHGGKKTHLKLKDGGHVDGKPKRHRLDRANGGRAKGSHKTVVNVVMPQHGSDGARPMPMPVPGPRPMPPVAAAGGPGGGMPPPRPPMMGPPVAAGAPMPRKAGGRVPKYPIDDGSGGGIGRLEKIKAYGDSAGGDVENEPFAEDGENKMKRGGKC